MVMYYEKKKHQKLVICFLRWLLSEKVNTFSLIWVVTSSCFNCQFMKQNCFYCSSGNISMTDCFWKNEPSLSKTTTAHTGVIFPTTTISSMLLPSGYYRQGTTVRDTSCISGHWRTFTFSRTSPYRIGAFEATILTSRSVCIWGCSKIADLFSHSSLFTICSMRYIRGLKGVSTPPVRATWMTDSLWDEMVSSNKTTLLSVSTGTSVKKSEDATMECWFCKYSSLFFELLEILWIHLPAVISMKFQGLDEERKSNNPHLRIFKFLSCLHPINLRLKRRSPDYTNYTNFR